MSDHHYLVNKSQWLLLAEDDMWIDLHKPFASNKKPKIFLTVEDAKNAIMTMRSKNKIGIYSDDTLYQVFGVLPETFFLKEDPSDLESPVMTFEEAEAQESEEDEREEQYFTSENGILSSNIEKTVNTPLITDFEDLLASMIALFDRFTMTKRELPVEFTHVNQTMQDELHFSEFEQLNVVEGYQAWRRIHDARVERRRIKNEMQVVKMAEELFNGFGTADLQEVLNRIDGMRHRQYSPRTDHYPNRQKLSENREESDAS